MRKILVAEDNAVNRELLREILEASDYEVIEAEDGEQALAKVTSAAPDLMLLDINMPVLDGFGVLQRLRNSASPKVPVVAVTAYAMKEDRERITAAGFDGYISKPIDPSALLTQVERLLNGKN